MLNTKNCVVVAINTKRGFVYVEFDYKGNLLDVRAIEPDKWDDKTWRKNQSKLIDRALKLCYSVNY